MLKSDILIIGAGAAGLLAAGTAVRQGFSVTLLERNNRPARKVMITGKGRCNVTNACVELSELIAFVPVNGRFLYSAFSLCMPDDIMRLFEGLGVPLKVERGRRVFPASDRASDIVDMLGRYAQGAHRIQGRATALMIENSRVTGAVTQDGTRISAQAVVVATGGLSYPATGSTGDGYLLARQAGHSIVEPKPSLVPLEVHEGFCSDLQGLSLRNVSLRVTDTKNEKEIYRDFGEMLFTHFGVSGPMILSASSHMRKMEAGRYLLSVDLKPALTSEQLDARIQRDFIENANRNFINALDALLPKKLVPVMVKLSGIEPSRKTNQITREMRRLLVEACKNLKLTVTGFRPIEEAIVTSGGVCVREIDPKTMESKRVSNLYFAGEVMDVDAYTGGFNLQIAFATGNLAGLSACEKIRKESEESE